MSKEIISIRCTTVEKEELSRLLFSIKSLSGKENNMSIILKALNNYHHNLLLEQF